MPRSRFSTASFATISGLFWGLVSCNAVLDLGGYNFDGNSGGAGTSNSTSSGGNGGSGGSGAGDGNTLSTGGGATQTGSGATGGMATTGQGGAEGCAEGEKQSCYSGENATLGVGECKAGQQTCDQGQWGACVGEVTPQTEDCFTDNDEDCNGDGKCPSDGWTVGIGEADADTLGGLSVNSAGDVVAAVNIGEGDAIRITKLDAKTGATLWEKTYASQGSAVRDVAVDPNGNVWVTGALIGSIMFGTTNLVSAGGVDIFVLKLDSNGGHLWSVRFGGGGAQESNAIRCDVDGSAVIAGSFISGLNIGTFSFSANNMTPDLFLARLNLDGTVVEARDAGGLGTQVASDVLLDPQGNVLVTGRYDADLKFANDELPLSGGDDLLVAKLNNLLLDDEVWSFGFGGAMDDEGTALSLDSSGNLFVLGGSRSDLIDVGCTGLTAPGGAGNDSAVFAKFNALGGCLWSKRFGGAYAQGFGVAVDAAGNSFIAGGFSGNIDLVGIPMTSAGSTDIFYGKFAPNGAAMMSGRAGGTGADAAGAVLVDPNGALILGGTFEGFISLGSNPVVSVGMQDVFVTKFASQ